MVKREEKEGGRWRGGGGGEGAGRGRGEWKGERGEGAKKERGEDVIAHTLCVVPTHFFPH